jgi:hypothetical protein
MPPAGQSQRRAPIGRIKSGGECFATGAWPRCEATTTRRRPGAGMSSEHRQPGRCFSQSARSAPRVTRSGICRATHARPLATRAQWRRRLCPANEHIRRRTGSLRCFHPRALDESGTKMRADCQPRSGRIDPDSGVPEPGNNTSASGISRSDRQGAGLWQRPAGATRPFCRAFRADFWRVALRRHESACRTRRDCHQPTTKPCIAINVAAAEMPTKTLSLRRNGSDSTRAAINTAGPTQSRAAATVGCTVEPNQ